MKTVILILPLVAVCAAGWVLPEPKDGSSSREQESDFNGWSFEKGHLELGSGLFLNYEELSRGRMPVGPSGVSHIFSVRAAGASLTGIKRGGVFYCDRLEIPFADAPWVWVGFAEWVDPEGANPPRPRRGAGGWGGGGWGRSWAGNFAEWVDPEGAKHLLPRRGQVLCVDGEWDLSWHEKFP